MTNYRYEDDMRAGLDRAKEVAEHEAAAMPRNFSKLSDSLVHLADALEAVTCPFDAFAVSEAINDMSLLVRRTARDWEQAKKLIEEFEGK